VKWIVKLRSLPLALACLIASAAGLRADSFSWREKENRVDAQIEAWQLTKLLERIADATGWQVYVEPGTEHLTSARFKNLKTNEALRHLLSNLNYALLPQTNLPPKLFVYRTSLQDATELVVPRERLNRKTRRGLADELVVTLKPNAGETIEQLSRRLGGKIVGRIDGLKAYRLRFDDEEAAESAEAALRFREDLSVDYNFPVDRPARTDELTYSSSPSFRLRPRAPGDGARVVVGLIDTAVQTEGTALAEFLLPAISVMGEVVPAGARLTHGTSMSETILNGIAMAQEGSGTTPVRILPVDVYGRNPSTTTFEVAGGIYAAINGGANVINLSMGSDGSSALVRDVIQQGHEQGVIFVGAAGNESTTTPIYPAAYPEVIAVTAGDKRGTIAPYANYGNFVDVIAPGTTIVHYRNQSYLVSGTSASTAYISGLAAGMAVETGKSLAEVETKIRQNLSVNASSAKTPKP
jgi:hypothetical protein